MRSKFSAACATAHPWCTLRANFRLDRFILSPSGSDKTQIFPFFGLRHFLLSPIAGNLIKLNTGAEQKPKHQNRLRLHGEIWRTDSDGWRRGVVGSVVRCMNEVTLRWARLVLGWVTVFGRVYHHGM